MLVRVIIVCGVALLASIQTVRTAIASAFLSERPAVAERFWASHPQVNFKIAMAEIGRATAAGKDVPVATLRRLALASDKAPLAAEPFLVKGALAKTAGREHLAERLFLEARKRNPRSAAARYFLAELYLVSGRAADGLNEASALARLVPGGSQLLVPGLAEFAHTPGSVRPLKKMFLANPEIGQAVLAELSNNAANVDLIMTIADPHLMGAGGGPVPAWQNGLMQSLIERGEFVRAHALWSRFSGIRPSTPPDLFNRGFGKINAPPPFNWTFGSGSFGVAEPEAGGRLRVIFYGRENAQLASQLLLLTPGQYRIRMEASGDTEGQSGLEWSVICQPGTTKLAGISLSGATLTGTRLGETFIVPSQGCAAQWLKLFGTAKEFAKSEQVTIGEFDLSPVGRR